MYIIAKMIITIKMYYQYSNSCYYLGYYYYSSQVNIITWGWRGLLWKWEWCGFQFIAQLQMLMKVHNSLYTSLMLIFTKIFCQHINTVVIVNAKFI